MTSPVHRRPDTSAINWAAVLQAEKDARWKATDWTDRYTAGVLVCSTGCLDLVADTPEGAFSLRMTATHERLKSQFKLSAYLDGGRREVISRLCFDPAHHSDDLPVHWHHFQSLPGIKEVRTVVEDMPLEAVTRETMEAEFMVTMNVRNYQGELAR